MESFIAKKDLEEARHAIVLLAVKEGVSEAVIRASMMEAISVGLANQDPAVQAKWGSITPDGENITPGRLIAWAVKQIQELDPISNNFRDDMCVAKITFCFAECRFRRRAAKRQELNFMNFAKFIKFIPHVPLVGKGHRPLSTGSKASSRKGGGFAVL